MNGKTGWIGLGLLPATPGVSTARTSTVPVLCYGSSATWRNLTPSAIFVVWHSRVWRG